MTRGSRLDRVEVDDLVVAVVREQVGVARAPARRAVGEDVAEGGAAPQRGPDERPAERVGDARQRDELLARRVVGLELVERERTAGVRDQAVDAQPPGGRVDAAAA